MKISNDHNRFYWPCKGRSLIDRRRRRRRIVFMGAICIFAVKKTPARSLTKEWMNEWMSKLLFICRYELLLFMRMWMVIEQDFVS